MTKKAPFKRSHTNNLARIIASERAGSVVADFCSVGDGLLLDARTRARLALLISRGMQAHVAAENKRARRRLAIIS